MGRLPWTLADFPAGYELYLHKSPRPRPSPQTVPRRDFLLYGKLNALPSPHFTHLKREKLTGSTDVPFFASPLEFVLHAEWLMRGAHRTPDKSRAPRCACKYCDVDVRGRKQSAISKELRARRADVLASLGEDGDGDGDGNGNADADELADDN